MAVDADLWARDVDPHIQAIADQKAQLLSAQRLIFGRPSKKMFAADLIYGAAINRALKNAGGFVHCITDFRFSVSLLILRGQLDTLCRVYGLQVAADQGRYIKAFLSGRIRGEVDKTGAKLTDRVLVQHLEKVRPGALDMYTSLAGSAHLSITHFLSTFSTPDEEGRFSGVTHEKDEDVAIEEFAGATLSFRDVTDTLLSAFNAYGEQGSSK